MVILEEVAINPIAWRWGWLLQFAVRPVGQRSRGEEAKALQPSASHGWCRQRALQGSRGSVVVLKHFCLMAKLISSSWSFASAGVVPKVNVGVAGVVADCSWLLGCTAGCWAMCCWLVDGLVIHPECRSGRWFCDRAMETGRVSTIISGCAEEACGNSVTLQPR